MALAAMAVVVTEPETSSEKPALLSRLFFVPPFRALHERFSAEITLLSAHDPTEFVRAAGREVNRPVDPVRRAVDLPRGEET
jgi:hypothetical protein